MTSASSRPRLEQELRTTLRQLIASTRETSALTDTLDRALRDDPQARLIAAGILERWCDSAPPNARAQALKEHLDRTLPANATADAMRARRFVAPDANDGPAPAPSAAAVDPADGAGSLSGVVLKGRFVLKQPIGRGATGVVYRAFDRSPGLHPAQIAVKVLHDGLQREQVTLARVRHDFAVSQSLEHPNIAKVFDFYRDEAYCFYTMELVNGESLRRLMDLLGPEPMSLAEVSPLVRDMGAALAHAHRRDIVHGDFKPENVVVTRNLAAKVLDFGLARAAHAVHRRLGAQAERDVTLPPAYASSEVLEGSDPDAIDDVYSFACVCYELLAGHLPFGALDALAARDAGLEPVRIEGLSDAQWRALSRALALRARDRTSGVGELIAQLSVDGDSPSVGAPAALPRAESRRVAHAKPRSRSRHEPARSRRPRKSRPWLAIALLAGIVLVLGVVYVTLQRDTRPEMMASTAPDASERAAPSTPAQRLDPAPAAVTPAPTAARKPDDAAAPAGEPAPDAAVANPGDRIEPEPPPSPATTAALAEASAAAPEATESSIPGTEAAPATPAAAPPAPENADASSMPADASPASATAAAFAFPAPQYAMSESKSLVSIPIERKDGRGPATVVWWTVEGDARAYEDYAYLGRRTESFADGETRRYIQIPVVSDGIAEGDEDFYVELASPDDAADPDALTRTAVLIRDDDH